VVHGRTAQDVLGLSSGQASQEFTLADFPVVEPANAAQPGRALAVYQNVDDPTGSIEIPWNQIEHLILSGPDDNTYMVYYDAQGRAVIRFGDGLNGSIPARNQPMYCQYRIGGGVRGNIEANLITGFADEEAFSTVTVAESSAMAGGADPETLEEIRSNAITAWRSQDRAVSAIDFKRLALRVPGVLKASAFALNYSSVNLYISSRPSTDEEELLFDVVERLQEYLIDRVLLGTTVNILPAQFIGVYIGASWDPDVGDRAVTVYCDPVFDREDVYSRVVAALYTLLSYDEVDFGEVISVSKIQFAWCAVC
jgi:predicted phage baseplate assembly protein